MRVKRGDMGALRAKALLERAIHSEAAILCLPHLALLKLRDVSGHIEPLCEILLGVRDDLGSPYALEYLLHLQASRLVSANFIPKGLYWVPAEFVLYLCAVGGVRDCREFEAARS